MMDNDENARTGFFEKTPHNGMACCEQYEDSCSRDSGVSDMDVDMTVEFPTENKETVNILDEAMVELSVFEEGPFAKGIFNDDQRALKKLGKRIAFQNITNIPSVHESPKARESRFGGRLQRAQTSSFGRKRQIGFTIGESKKRKPEVIEEEGEHNQNIPSCSSLCQPSTFSNPLHRVQSTSVLERGVYAQHSQLQLLHKVEDVHYSLPYVPTSDSQAYRRIAGHTMVQLISSLSPSEFNSKYFLVDCRYPYEYEGGHMKNAVNVFDRTTVEGLFYPECPQQRSEIQKRIPIFYCEYSQKRGPSMASALRTFDRRRNELKYPYVDFKEIYVVDKGYKGFFEKFNCVEGTCEPSSYTPMDHPDFSHVLRRYNFHKSKSTMSATCIRPMVAMDSQSKAIARRASAESPSTRPSSRRGLFTPATPETQPFPVGKLLFS